MAEPLALVRSDLSGPGIRRRRHGRGFRYLGPDGAPVRDPEVLARIKALVIPPAWEDVWIADVADGHIQAIGTDDYLREVSGDDFTAKDFRTWHATVLAAVGLAVSERAAGSESARKRAIAPGGAGGVRLPGQHRS